LAPKPDAKLLRAPTEHLPFNDKSFDVVVSTLVLCTVDDQPRAPREVRRVLRPGGKLLFIEHVRSDDEKVARWQDRLLPLNVRLMHGCHCNRPTLDGIRAAGFEVTQLEHGTITHAPPFVRPLIVGVALNAGGFVKSPLFVAIVLVATSLGVIVPVLKDSNNISSSFGQLVIAAASIADFGAIILFSLFFSRRGSTSLAGTLILLGVFGLVLVLVGFAIAGFEHSTSLSRVLQGLQDTTAPSPTRATDPPRRGNHRPVVVRVTRTAYGRALSDGRGFALYRFSQDRLRSSTCYAPCAAAWPPYLVSKRPSAAGPGANAGLVGAVRRADGGLQVTYAGHPLYYYVGDRHRREVLCQGVTKFGGKWYVVAPDGSAIA